jgi:hypothetical protein
LFFAKKLNKILARRYFCKIDLIYLKRNKHGSIMFSKNCYNSPQRTKFLLVASIIAALAVMMGLILRSCSTSSHQRLGLPPLSITDANGDKWVLDLLKGQPLSRFKGSNAKPGPPLLLRTDVQTKGREVSIGLIVEGQAGEKYVGGVTKNGQQQPPPRLKILNKAGAVLAAGDFKYG